MAALSAAGVMMSIHMAHRDVGGMNHKQKKRVSGRMCGAGMVETLSRAG